jgi:spore coat protein H
MRSVCVVLLVMTACQPLERPTFAPPADAATSSVDAPAVPPPLPADAATADARSITPDVRADAGATDSRPITMAPYDAGPPVSVAAVFEPRVLHRIEITVESQYLAQLDKDLEARVPCTIVFDGTMMTMAGIRKKGGPGSLRPLAEKAAFSMKFNEFVKGQKLAGLSKLLLNNAVMDPSFLHEHMAYEIARKAGAAAPLTAHGIVTFNGQPYGLYVVREAINDDFMERNYGKENQGGNLYETGDFIDNPESPELKDEVEEMRTRDDVREASRLVKTTPDAQWVAVVSAKLDVPSFLSGFAVEALVDHWDGYFFGPHNYYVYDHPGTKRFVFLVAGMDDVFSRIRPPTDSIRALLGTKFLQFPETKAQLRTKLADIVRTMNVAELNTRMDQVALTIHSYAPADNRTRDDYARFDESRAEMKGKIAAIKAWTVPAF